MRLALAILLSVLILLSVHSYLRFAESLRGRHVAAREETIAPGNYSAQITLTFDAEADAFALDHTSLLFTHQDQVLLKREDRVLASEPLVVDSLGKLIVGPNAFHFSCVPRDNSPNVAKAVRLQIFRDGHPIAEQTLWAKPGLTPQGEIRIEIPPLPADTAHDDHK